MNGQAFEAIYQNGVLRPTKPLSGLTEGQVVSVTLQNSAVAPEEMKRREEEFLSYLESHELLAHPSPPTEAYPKDYRPIVLEGEPLSETVIRLRD
jgi:predicted DNA-binding antitoxin AbrB/MazE fold protein